VGSVYLLRVAAAGADMQSALADRKTPSRIIFNSHEEEQKAPMKGTSVNSQGMSRSTSPKSAMTLH
jgi:hypothetical protein